MLQKFYSFYGVNRSRGSHPFPYTFYTFLQEKNIIFFHQFHFKNTKKIKKRRKDLLEIHYGFGWLSKNSQISSVAEISQGQYGEPNQPCTPSTTV